MKFIKYVLAYFNKKKPNVKVYNTRPWKIVSDGTAATTKIYYDGTQLTHVSKILWEVDAINNRISKAHLEIVLPKVELNLEDKNIKEKK